LDQTGHLWLRSLFPSQRESMTALAFSHTLDPKDLSWRVLVNQGETLLQQLVNLEERVRPSSLKVIMLAIHESTEPKDTGSAGST